MNHKTNNLTVIAVLSLLVFMLLTSSTNTQNNVLVTMPAKPTYTYTEYIYKSDDLKRTIIYYSKQGYIMNNLIYNNNKACYFLVMVKY